MVCQNNELLLNGVLIGLAKSFLQYVAESWPWVGTGDVSLQEQIRVIADRQKQDVSEIVSLLLDREHSIDFGSFPTEYTDLHFISLQSLLGHLQTSQQRICQSIDDASESLRAAGDVEGAETLAQIRPHESDIQSALNAISAELKSPATI